MISTTIIHCPACGFAKQEDMPIEACLVVYPCSQCGAILRPKSGDCCVFCSYGDDKCPPMQEADSSQSSTGGTVV